MLRSFQRQGTVFQMNFGGIRHSIPALVLCIASGIPAQASLIYSNFSPEPPGYVGESWGLSAGVSGFWRNKSQWAMGFTLSQDAILETATLPLSISSGDVRVSLMDTAANGAPGAVLDSFLIPSPGSDATQLFSGSFLSTPLLNSGQNYWLAAEIDGLSGSGSWYTAYTLFPPDGIPIKTGLLANRNPYLISNSNWSFGMKEQSAFELGGQFISAVPEPASSTLAAIGVLAVFLSRRRRNSSE